MCYKFTLYQLVLNLVVSERPSNEGQKRPPNEGRPSIQGRYG